MSGSFIYHKCNQFVSTRLSCFYTLEFTQPRPAALSMERVYFACPAATHLDLHPTTSGISTTFGVSSPRLPHTGRQSFNFSYPKINGNLRIVSLSDGHPSLAGALNSAQSSL